MLKTKVTDTPRVAWVLIYIYMKCVTCHYNNKKQQQKTAMYSDTGIIVFSIFKKKQKTFCPTCFLFTSYLRRPCV